MGVDDFDPHPRRPRSASTRYLLQMDTGFFDAPNDTDGKWAVHVAIDDATNLITDFILGYKKQLMGIFMLWTKLYVNTDLQKILLPINVLLSV